MQAPRRHWHHSDASTAKVLAPRRCHRGQARLLQLARALLEQACLRCKHCEGTGTPAIPSRASPAPTGDSVFVGAGLPAMQAPRRHWHHSDAIAGKPGSYRRLGLRWSRLACDASTAKALAPQRYDRGQARLLQAARSSLEQACLRCKHREGTGTPPMPSRASPAPTAGAGSVGAGLPAMQALRRMPLQFKTAFQRRYCNAPFLRSPMGDRPKNRL